MKSIRAAVIGKDGRTSAIVEALQDSRRVKEDVETLSTWKFSSIEKSQFQEVQLSIERLKKKNKTPDIVLCGPEEPLAKGIVDWMWNEFRIPCIGPTKELAKLESSKSFTRNLLKKHHIPGNPEFRIFTSSDRIVPYLEKLGSFVVKPDGLTGGKGVKVFGEHLHSFRDALQYCEEVFSEGHTSLLIEEKLDGEEFSLQSFCDGIHVVDMPVVQDHKRAGVGDTGPNTGGMGSYSCENHSLPFLSPTQLQEASKINKLVAQALHKETGQLYKGILYGGFMLTRNGVRLIEYNARFGDPEALNVLSLLETDFGDICEAIVEGTLDKLDIQFEKLATVCKYVVPEGYPEHPIKGEPIDWSKVKASGKLRIFPAAVDKGDKDKKILSGSRAVAFVGIGANVAEAEKLAETAANSVKGPVTHRWDIGTKELLQKRITHMERVMAGESDDKYLDEATEHNDILKLVP